MLISHIVITTWEALGERIALARRSAGFTQADLASKVGLDRTAIAKAERGTRQVSTLELAQIAQSLQRPIPWFLANASPAIVSRRSAREGVEHGADIALEVLVADVEQLIEMCLLDPPRFPGLGFTVESVEQAEEAARRVRAHIGRGSGPILDLVDGAEALGLYAFVLDLEANIEGSYVALEGGAGVALVQGRDPSGKRRFTLAHELGHHVFQDEYSSEWVTGGRDERERLISAFAIHFLVPRSGLRERWRELHGDADARSAAIVLGAAYGVSWSALCGQLRNLDIVDEQMKRHLVSAPPSRIEFMERRLKLIDVPSSPAVPPGFMAAVARGYRRQLLGRDRALELLRLSVDESDLPDQHDVPLEAMGPELGAFEEH